MLTKYITDERTNERISILYLYNVLTTKIRNYYFFQIAVGAI